MDINLKEQYEDFLLLAKEVCLNVLKEADNKRKIAIENNDLEAVKSIEEKLFPKYEKLFFEFSLELGDEIDREKMENIEKIVYDIIESHKMDEGHLWEEVRKRIEYEGDSGSEVVKKLYEYQKREISHILDDLEQKLQKLLKNQKAYEMKMADAIQYEEEAKWFEEVKRNGKLIDLINEKILNLLNKLDETDVALITKWRYEIYGTVSKSKLLESYKTL